MEVKYSEIGLEPQNHNICVLQTNSVEQWGNSKIKEFKTFHNRLSTFLKIHLRGSEWFAAEIFNLPRKSE